MSKGEGLTEPLRAALKWLRDRNGTGAFDKDGVLMASGDLAPFMRTTWNGLFRYKLVSIDGKRVSVTEKGMAFQVGATKVRRPVYREYNE